MTLLDPQAAKPPAAGRFDVAPPSTAAVQIRRERAGPWIHLVQPLGFEWNHVALPIPSLPTALNDLRVLHLTDFHLTRRWSSAYDEILGRIKLRPPDLLLFTGDFINNKRNHAPALPILRRLIDGFQARLGCFAVTGNHDSPALTADLQGTNVKIIEHCRELITVGDASIELIGLVGRRRHELDADWVRSLPPKRCGVPRIVLSHFPDTFARTWELKPDLFLAGHTHGGQVCLPGGRAIMCHDRLPRRLCKGVNRVDDTWLVVGRGLGFTTPPIRLFCPSEVIEIKLTQMRE